MKRESTEARQARRKRDAVRGILFFAMLQIITSVACASLYFIPGMPQWAIILCLVLAILWAQRRGTSHWNTTASP